MKFVAPVNYFYIFGPTEIPIDHQGYRLQISSSARSETKAFD